LFDLKKFYLKTLPTVLILVGLSFILASFGSLILDEVWFFIKEVKNQPYSIAPTHDSVKDSIFARFLSTRPITIDPVNKEFSLVIEKIGVNAPIVKDVSVTNEKEYIEALKGGIAHASKSPYPSKDIGNVYLFAHASLDFWRLGKYARVFNLLRKLEKNDRIHLFYKNKTYVYEVVTVEKLPGWDTYPLEMPTIEPLLTLQTCDPPGTTLNRLVVTSKLIEVNE